MRHGRLSSRPPRAQGLCKVTVLVPKDYAEGIRQFAEELRARPPKAREWTAPRFRFQARRGSICRLLGEIPAVG
jgi:hypothetical protein